MYFGLTVSLAAHLALLGWALVSFQTTQPYKLREPEPVEVAIISADELVRLRQGDRDSKKLETRPADKIETKPTDKEAKREIAKTVPPPAASPAEPHDDPISKKLADLQPVEAERPTAEELAAKKAAEEAAKKAAAAKAAEELALRKAEEEKKKQAEAEAERKRQAEAELKRKAEAEKKRTAERWRKRLAAEKKRREKEAERKRRLAEAKRREKERQSKNFDSGKISALLNKIPDAAALQGGSPDPNARPDAPRGARAGAPEGRDSRLTASQRSLLGVMMKRAVSRCWNINSGLEGADRVVVELEVRLGPDGRLQSQPRVANNRGGAIFQDAVNSAVRALMQCEPYDLPQQFYKGGWDHMVVTFDPQKMF
jgi:colicin import membrane protein